MAKNPDLNVETPEPPNAFEIEEQLQERIRQRAHELYVARGQEDGHDLEDWVQAEAEIGVGTAPLPEP